MPLHIKGQNQFYLKIIINLNCIQDSLYTIAGKSICRYKQQANGHSSKSKTGPYSSPSLFCGFESSYLGNFTCLSCTKCVHLSCLCMAFHKKITQ